MRVALIEPDHRPVLDLLLDEAGLVARTTGLDPSSASANALNSAMSRQATSSTMSVLPLTSRHSWTSSRACIRCLSSAKPAGGRMVVKLDADQGAQSPIDQIRRQQRNRPGDTSFLAQPPQPAGDGRGGKGDNLGQLLRGTVGILLHGIEQLQVKIVEHVPNLAKIWHGRQRNRLPCAIKMR